MLTRVYVLTAKYGKFFWKRRAINAVAHTRQNLFMVIFLWLKLPFLWEILSKIYLLNKINLKFYLLFSELLNMFRLCSKFLYVSTLF